MTPEQLVAAVAEGRTRPVALPDGRIALRPLPEPPRDLIGRVWHDLTLAAAEQLTRELVHMGVAPVMAEAIVADQRQALQ